MLSSSLGREVSLLWLAFSSPGAARWGFTCKWCLAFFEYKCEWAITMGSVDLEASGESFLFNLLIKVPCLIAWLRAACHRMMVLERMSRWRMTHWLNCLPPDVTNDAAIQKMKDAPQGSEKIFFFNIKSLICSPSPSRRRCHALCLAGEAEETITTLCLISLKPNYNIYPHMTTWCA